MNSSLSIIISQNRLGYTDARKIIPVLLQQQLHQVVQQSVQTGWFPFYLQVPEVAPAIINNIHSSTGREGPSEAQINENSKNLLIETHERVLIILTVPIARATSSLVWWSSIWMSPVALTCRSNNPCDANCWNLYIQNPL